MGLAHRIRRNGLGILLSGQAKLSARATRQDFLSNRWKPFLGDDVTREILRLAFSRYEAEEISRQDRYLAMTIVKPSLHSDRVDDIDKDFSSYKKSDKVNVLCCIGQRTLLVSGPNDIKDGWYTNCLVTNVI